MKQRVAIVGAGLAGLTAACGLQKQFEVTLFEKSRAPGGRAATRHAAPYAFDHGAQFFTVKNAAVREWIAPLLSAGVIAPWYARFVELYGQDCLSSRQWGDDLPHYVGVPGMRAIGVHLAKGLAVHYATCVAQVVRVDGQWALYDSAGKGLGLYDWVLFSSPVSQTQALLPDCFVFKRRLDDFQMSACYSLMLGFEAGFDLGFDAALVSGASISWVSANHSKPGRLTPPAYVVHATNDWANRHVDAEDDWVKAALLMETKAVLGERVMAHVHLDVHRWRFANIGKRRSDPYLLDLENRLGVCGDWLIQGRIEAAMRSGIALSDHLIQRMG